MGTGRFPVEPGGARRDRTADLLHAMQALSQLSYSPESKRILYGFQNWLSTNTFKIKWFGKGQDGSGEDVGYGHFWEV